ncbi:hypothetical protein BDY24DRAFT_87746 [Mrakia frigida]|uniref:uncharacterized protein n=1 Tax=Mrakia frigida TaxID=29902 RepID=UPI003FCC1B0B
MGRSSKCSCERACRWKSTPPSALAFAFASSSSPSLFVVVAQHRPASVIWFDDGSFNVDINVCFRSRSSPKSPLDSTETRKRIEIEMDDEVGFFFLLCFESLTRLMVTVVRKGIDHNKGKSAARGSFNKAKRERERAKRKSMAKFMILSGSAKAIERVQEGKNNIRC